MSWTKNTFRASLNAKFTIYTLVIATLFLDFSSAECPEGCELQDDNHCYCDPEQIQSVDCTEAIDDGADGCVFDCTENDSCNDARLTCVSDEPGECVALCSAESGACNGLRFECSSAKRCIVECGDPRLFGSATTTWNNNCNNAFIYCGEQNTPDCLLTCDRSHTVCGNATMYCSEQVGECDVSITLRTNESSSIGVIYAPTAEIDCLASGNSYACPIFSNMTPEWLDIEFPVPSDPQEETTSTADAWSVIVPLAVLYLVNKLE